MLSWEAPGRSQRGSFEGRKFTVTTHNDGGDLADGGSELLGETTREEGRHEGKGRRVDLGNEGGGSEELDGLGDLLNGVDQGVAVEAASGSACRQARRDMSAPKQLGKSLT